jgi:hypothetical protein
MDSNIQTVSVGRTWGSSDDIVQHDGCEMEPPKDRGVIASDSGNSTLKLPTCGRNGTVTRQLRTSPYQRMDHPTLVWRFV